MIELLERQAGEVRCGPWQRPPVPVVVPARVREERLVVELLERVAAEQLRPALLAREAETFFHHTFEQQPLFAQRMDLVGRLMQELTGDAAGPSPSAVEHMAADAHAFGGDDWEHAMRRSLKNLVRGHRVRERLEACALSSGQRNVLAVADFYQMCWLWSLFAARELFQDPSVGTPGSIAAVLSMMREAGQQLYALPRQIELELQEAARSAQTELDLGERDDDPGSVSELYRLEAEAQAESERLLASEGD